MKYALPVILILIVLLILIYLIKSRNHFVVLKNRVKDQESQIVVQLKRRYDLIPNLVETAKGYAGFEKSTLEAVTAARTNAVNAKNLNEEIAANDEMTHVLSRLIAVSEAYPELKSNQNFMQLQQELSATENKIAMARQFYNDTVLKYNNAIQMFPANIVAALFGYHACEYLNAEEKEKQTIKLDANSFKL